MKLTSQPHSVMLTFYSSPFQRRKARQLCRVTSVAGAMTTLSRLKRSRCLAAHHAGSPKCGAVSCLIFFSWVLKRKLISLIYHTTAVNQQPPLRTAYCYILTLRTAYGLILALRTVYRSTAKTLFGGIHLHIKKQSVAWAGTLLFANVSFVVFAW